jgi:hypothetical protein
LTYMHIHAGHAARTALGRSLRRAVLAMPSASATEAAARARA